MARCGRRRAPLSGGLTHRLGCDSTYLCAARGRIRRALFLALCGLLVASSLDAVADVVEVVAVKLERSGDGSWNIHTTLRHADTGWDHYADAWRVVDPDGRVVATRTLYHPHVDEQPFTRGLSGVRIPADVRTVRVEARDTVHGWSPRSVRVDLGEDRGDRFEISN